MKTFEEYLQEIENPDGIDMNVDDVEDAYNYNLTELYQLGKLNRRIRLRCTEITNLYYKIPKFIRILFS